MLSGGGFLGNYGRQSPLTSSTLLRLTCRQEERGISDGDYWSIVAHVMRNGVSDDNPGLDASASYAMATNIPGVNPTLTQQRREPDRPTGVVKPARLKTLVR